MTARFSVPDSLPRGFGLYIIDEARGIYQELDSVFAWLQRKDRIRNLTVIAGDDGYVMERTRRLKRIPLKFALYPLYPNPMRGTAMIRYAIPMLDNGNTVCVPVRLSVYDLKGRQVTELLNDKQEPGNHLVTWDGSRRGGGRLGPGTYVLKFTAGNRFKAVQRVQIIR